eukprot:1335491-Pyramimonas_sp.AAC.1
MDLALHDDIDIHQLKYFVRTVEERLQPTDAVILITHQPLWLLDWFDGNKAAADDRNLAYLVNHHLGTS